MRHRGPLANSYLAAAAMVVFALVPYLALSGANTALAPVLAGDLHLSRSALELTAGMSNAAYAFGTVLAVQFAQHLPPRRMLVIYASLFLLASVMASVALTPGFFIAGRVLQGLCTSLMLIAAVPPLVIGWPTSKMRYTAVVMNMCIFGAVAIGPVIGGAQAASGDWRLLFWIVTGVGGLALLFALLTYEDDPPADRSAPWDVLALFLGGGGCGAAFFGASELTSRPFVSVLTMLPLLVGVGLILTLVIYQFNRRRPLMPVRGLATTKPVAGIIIAMTAGSASVATIALVETELAKTSSPLHAGMLFWPEFGGAFLTAILFGALFRTRFIPVLAFTGMGVLAGGIAMFAGALPPGDAVVLVGSGLLGIGVGASVSPALFIAGFSMRSAQIQRVFALIELLRGVAAFMVAPVMLHLAVTVSSDPHTGLRTALWACFGIAIAGGAAGIYLFALGRARLEKPDLDRWQEGEDGAWDSPPLLAGIRHDSPLPAGLPQPL